MLPRAEEASLLRGEPACDEGRHSDLHEVPIRRRDAVRTLPVPTYPDLACEFATVTGSSRGIGAAAFKSSAAYWSAVAGRRSKER
jgi:hypothetical protein